MFVNGVSTHCNENPIYVFPEKQLRGLSVPVSRLIYIFPGSVPIFSCSRLQADRPWEYINYRTEDAKFLFLGIFVSNFVIVSLQCRIAYSIICNSRTLRNYFAFRVFFVLMEFFSKNFFYHCFICRPPDSTVSEDAESLLISTLIQVESRYGPALGHRRNYIVELLPHPSFNLDS